MDTELFRQIINQLAVIISILLLLGGLAVASLLGKLNSILGQLQENNRTRAEAVRRLDDVIAYLRDVVAIQDSIDNQLYDHLSRDRDDLDEDDLDEDDLDEDVGGYSYRNGYCNQDGDDED